MKYRNKGLVLALEGDEEDDVIVETPASEEDLVEATAEVEAGAADVQDESVEIQDLDGAMNDASEGVDELEQIQDVMEESVESGEGVSETAAEIAEIAVESIRRRLGIKRNKTAFPAMESFVGRNSRLASTKIAVEAINIDINGIWKSIQKAFHDLMERLVAFLKTLFSQTASSIKAAEALKAKVAGLDDSSVSEKELESRDIATAFYSGVRTDGETLAAILENHLKLTKAAVESGRDIVAGAKDLGEGIKSLSLDETKLKSIVDSMTDGFDSITNKDLQKKFFSYTKSYVGPLVGGNGFAVETMIDEHVGFKFAFIPLESKQHDTNKVPTLSLADITKTCDTVIELAKATDDFKKNEGVLKDVGKNIDVIIGSVIKVAELVNEGEGDKAKETKDTIAHAKKMVDGLKSAISTVSAKIPASNVQACKAALRYASLSAKQYSAAAAK